MSSSNEPIARLATDKIHVSPLYVMGKVLKRVLKALMWIIILVITVYTVVLVPTVVRFVPTEDFGLVVTRDPTIRGGGVPAGKLELVSFNNKVGATDSVRGKMQAAFTWHTGTSKMTVIAGPNGRLLQNPDGVMTLNGKSLGSKVKKPVNYSLLESGKWYLRNQYLMKCVDGSCRKGTFYIMDKDSILGEIKTSDSEPLINQITGEDYNVKNPSSNKTDSRANDDNVDSRANNDSSVESELPVTGDNAPSLEN